MSMKMRIEPKESYLLVTVSGTFNPREANDLSRQFVEAAVEHGRTKILVDIRPLKGKISTLERWDYGVHVARLHLDHVSVAGQSPLQLAYVADYPLLDPNRFAETVAQNRGVTLMATDDLGKALEFLGVASDKGTAAAQGE